MKVLCVGLLLISFLFIFQGCTGCNDDDDHEIRNGNSIQKTNHYEDNNTVANHRSGGKVIVKMKKENGVYKIPVMINGVLMDFIFDTGAGMISISDLEANFLYKQGKVTNLHYS